MEMAQGRGGASLRFDFSLARRRGGGTEGPANSKRRRRKPGKGETALGLVRGGEKGSRWQREARGLAWSQAQRDLLSKSVILEFEQRTGGNTGETPERESERVSWSTRCATGCGPGNGEQTEFFKVLRGAGFAAGWLGRLVRL